MKVNGKPIFVRYDLIVPGKEAFPPPCSQDSGLQEIIDCVIKGDISNVGPVVEKNLNRLPPLEIIYNALLPAMKYVSQLWEESIYYLPQTLNSSDAMQIGISLCEKMMESPIKKKGIVLTHTAEGDIHDLGQKIVNALLRSRGYEVIDLGNDVPVEVVVDAVMKYNPVLLTGTAGVTMNVDAFKRISEHLISEGKDLPFGCGGGGVSLNLLSFELGIFGKDASQAPPMAEDALNGLSWKTMRKKYNE